MVVLKKTAVFSKTLGWLRSLLNAAEVPLLSVEDRDQPWRAVEDLLEVSSEKPGLSAWGGSAEAGLAGDGLLPDRDDTGLDSSSLSKPYGSSDLSSVMRGRLWPSRRASIFAALLAGATRLELTLAL